MTVKEEIEQIANGRHIYYMPCKIKWIEKIARGEKKEEYRAAEKMDKLITGRLFVLHAYDYSKPVVMFERGAVTIKKGRKEWGAPKEDVASIAITRVLKTWNINQNGDDEKWNKKRN